MKKQRNLISSHLIEKGKGFTLIELLVVVAIIGLLASFVIASLNSARAKARDSYRLATINQIVTAMNMYNDDQVGSPRYPTAMSDASDFPRGKHAGERMRHREIRGLCQCCSRIFRMFRLTLYQIAGGAIDSFM
jgi:prepilin-type N-terminal cleavage/methylation domain-containing protein